MVKHRLPPHPNLPDELNKPFVYQPAAPFEHKTDIDPTKLRGYRPEWTLRQQPPAPIERERTVPKIISPRLARKINATYRCAACWSDLEIFWHVSGEFAGNYTIECSYCGGDVSGFVTQSYIEYRIQQNEAEYEEAKIALSAAYPFLFPQREKRLPRTEAQNLKELGF